MGFQNKYRHTFTLKQMTPILHYQGEEEGATVRASEMKPKLDRFLFDLYADEIEESWIKKTEEKEEKRLPALDYQMNIFAEGKTTPWDKRRSPKDWPPKVPGGYFGNMKADQAVMNEKTEVVVTCYIDGLMEKIKDAFPMFIAATNFGSRQRMGYGCFAMEDQSWNRGKMLRKYRDKMNKNGKENILVYTLDYPQEVRNMGMKLDAIKDFHQHLKSGVGRGNYNKNCSLLLKRYPAKTGDDSVNEKKAMKAALATRGAYSLGVLTREKDDRNAESELKQVSLENVIYKRGLFGFAGNYEFKSVIRKTEKRPVTAQKCAVTFRVEVGKTASGIVIKRFPSPITYYIDRNQIYLLVRVDHMEQLMEEKPRVRFRPGTETLALQLFDRNGKPILNNKGKPKDELKKNRTEAAEFTARMPEEFDVKHFFGFVEEQEVPCCLKAGRDWINGSYKLREFR